MNAVPGQFGQYGAGYQSVAGIPALNGTLTQNAGYFSNFVDYANGTYVIQFNAPNPSAISVSVGGDLSNLSNININGTTWTATATLQHDGGVLTAGSSEINIAGPTSSNPVSNFTVYAQGTNPSALTTAYQKLANNYDSLYTLNTENVVGNQATISEADNTYNGSVDGTISAHDIALQANSMPKLQNILWEEPVGAQNDKLQADSQAFNSLNPNTKVLVAIGGETWNGAQAQFEAVLNLAKANPLVANAASDDYTRVAYETAVLDINAVKEMRAVSSEPQNITAYLVSQGSNTYFVDREKAFITNQLGLKLSDYVKYQGVSFYPDNNSSLSSSSSPQDLYNFLEGGLASQLSYLQADKNDATASGLNELVYEFGIEGNLPISGASAAAINAFNNSSYATEWVAQEVGSAEKILGNGDGLEIFTGSYWGPQPDTLAPTTSGQQELNTFLSD